MSSREVGPETHDTSFSSARSHRSGKPLNYKPKTKKIEPYISPFIASALKRAEERVKERMPKRPPLRRPPPVQMATNNSYEWDHNVHTPGLFDPKLRKQEIFRLEPKNGSRHSTRRDQADTSLLDNSSFLDRHASSNYDKPVSPNQRVTVRTRSASPTRVPVASRQYQNSRGRSPSEPEHTTQKHNDNQHAKVTRSTSPIDEGVVTEILTAEQIHDKDPHYTFRHDNPQLQPQYHGPSIGTPGGTNMGSAKTRAKGAPESPFQKFLREHGHQREAMDPEALRTHYGAMIRDRLRTLLQHHRSAGAGGAEDDEALDEGRADPSRPYPYFSRLHRQNKSVPGSGILGGYFRPSDAADSQMMTRDLMASMAQIMTAVGDIVTKQDSRGRSRSSSYARRSKQWFKDTVAQQQFEEAVHGSHAPPHTPYTHYPQTPGSTAAGWQGATAGTTSHATPAATSAPAPSSVAPPTPVITARVKTPSSSHGLTNNYFPQDSQALRQQPQVSTAPPRRQQRTGDSGFVVEMAHALRPSSMFLEAVEQHHLDHQNNKENALQLPLPRNKAAVFDMIMTKLQAIEQCESELVGYLKQPRDRPDTVEVDQVLLDLKHSQQRQLKQQEQQRRYQQQRSQRTDTTSQRSGRSDGNSVRPSSSSTGSQYSHYEEPVDGGSQHQRTKSAHKQQQQGTREGLDHDRDQNQKDDDEDEEDLSAPAPPSVASTREGVPFISEHRRLIPQPYSAKVAGAESAAAANYDFLYQYPPLDHISAQLRPEFEAYKQRLQRAREMREVAFTRKHSTLAIAADTVADALCDRVIGSVASEIGGFVADYSKHYVTKL